MSATEVFNQGYSQYYNLLYADKDYTAEVDYLDRLMRKYAPQAKTILEYGSGTGGHGVLLNKRGYDVYGIERSSNMAEIARSRGLNCEVGDITTANVGRTFDSVMALFHVISYINGNTELIGLFQNTRKHLKGDGIFVFDVWFSPAVLHQMPEERVKKMADEAIEVTRHAKPVVNHFKNIVEVHYQIAIRDKSTGATSEFSEVHSMRHFSVPEIELIAAQTGFTLIGTEEFLSGKAPSESTWGVTFILRANHD
jgi:SAM-dependent methyltransferase